MKMKICAAISAKTAHTEGNMRVYKKIMPKDAHEAQTYIIRVVSWLKQKVNSQWREEWGEKKKHTRYYNECVVCASYESLSVVK